MARTLHMMQWKSRVVFSRFLKVAKVSELTMSSKWLVQGQRKHVWLQTVGMTFTGTLALGPPVDLSTGWYLTFSGNIANLWLQVGIGDKVKNTTFWVHKNAIDSRRKKKETQEKKHDSEQHNKHKLQLLGDICNRFPETNWWCHCHATNCPARISQHASSVADPPIWQVICVIHPLNLTALGVTWKHPCSHNIRHNVPSALDIYYRDIFTYVNLYKTANLPTEAILILSSLMALGKETRWPSLHPPWDGTLALVMQGAQSGVENRMDLLAAMLLSSLLPQRNVGRPISPKYRSVVNMFSWRK